MSTACPPYLSGDGKVDLVYETRRDRQMDTYVNLNLFLQASVTFLTSGKTSAA